MKISAKVYLIVTWLALINARDCDLQERKFARSFSGEKFLIRSFDQEYFSRFGSSNFTVKHLLRYLNFTTEEPDYPFIISSFAFNIFGIKGRFVDTRFCDEQDNFFYVILLIQNCQDQQNHSLLFNGCNMRNIGIKILVVHACKFSKSWSESVSNNSLAINRTSSIQFCQCEESLKYVRDCLNGGDTHTIPGSIYTILFLFVIFSSMFVFFAGIFMSVTQEYELNITN